MQATLINLLGIIWKYRAEILAAWPLVKQAQHEYRTNPDRKEFVTKQLLALKQFTPDNIDRAIDATVQLLQLAGVIK